MTESALESSGPVASGNPSRRLTIGRAVMGLSAGAWVPLVVGFSVLFPPQEAIQASAQLTLVNSVGKALATSVTGLLNTLGRLIVRRDVLVPSLLSAIGQYARWAISLGGLVVARRSGDCASSDGLARRASAIRC